MNASTDGKLSLSCSGDKMNRKGWNYFNRKIKSKGQEFLKKNKLVVLLFMEQ